MTFEVIPAVDVAGGRLVRMARDGLRPVEAFGGDPLAAANAFVRGGAGRLHVVDVDLASSGEPRNLEVLRSIAALGVPVQASGGVRTEAQVDVLLTAGADRVVVGSAALAEPERAGAVIAAFRDRVCVGLEVDGATIRPRGGGPEMPLWEALGWLGELDVRRYVLTEVGRVGSASGPDLDGIWALATHTGRPVLAAGGIGSVRDLRAVAALGGTVEGGIVGAALLEGGLDLGEALRAVGGDTQATP